MWNVLNKHFTYKKPKQSKCLMIPDLTRIRSNGCSVNLYLIADFFGIDRAKQRAETGILKETEIDC